MNSSSEGAQNLNETEDSHEPSKISYKVKENEMLHSKIKDLKQKISQLQIRLNEEVYIRMTLGTVLKEMIEFKDQAVNQEYKQFLAIDESIKLQGQEIKLLRSIMEKLLLELKYTRKSYADMEHSIEANVAESITERLTKLEAALARNNNIEEKLAYQSSELKCSSSSGPENDAVPRPVVLGKNLQQEQEINILLVGGKAANDDVTAFLNCLAMILKYESFDEAFSSRVREFVRSATKISGASFQTDSGVLWYSGTSSHNSFDINSCSAIGNNCKHYVLPIKNVKIRFICFSFCSSMSSDDKEILRCLGQFYHFHGFILFRTTEDEYCNALMTTIASQLHSYTSNAYSHTSNIALVWMQDHQNDFGHVVRSNNLKITFHVENVFMLNEKLFAYLKSKKYFDTAAPPVYYYHKKEWKKTSKQCKLLLQWIVKCLEKPQCKFCHSGAQTSNKNFSHETLFLVEPKKENAIYNFIYN